MHVARGPEPCAQGRGCLGPCPPTRRRENCSSHRFCIGSDVLTHATCRCGIETIDTGCAADKQSDVGLRRVFEHVTPLLRRLVEQYGRHMVQGSYRLNTTCMWCKAIVGTAHRGVKQRRNLASPTAKLYQAGAPLTLFADPACNMGGRPPRREHDIGPWRGKRGRTGLVEAKPGRAKGPEEPIVHIDKRGET